MFKALLKARIQGTVSGMFRGSSGTKKRGPGFKILVGLLALYMAAVILFMFGTMFYSICMPFAAAGLGWMYFALAGIIAFALCFVGSVFMTQSLLFASKDNEMLISMPVPPAMVLSSRVVTLLLLNVLYSAVVMVPAGVVWLMRMPVSAAGVVFFVICTLLVPLLSMALSIILGWAIASALSRVRNKNLITMVASLGFLGLYFYGYSRMQVYMEYLMANGETIAAAVRKSLFPAYHMGMAIHGGNVVSFLIFALCAVLPFAAVMYIVSRNFVKIVTTNRGTAKIRYKGGAMRASGVKAALLKKNLRHFVSSPMYMLNAGIGSVFAVALSVLLVVKREMFDSIIMGFGVSGTSGALPAIACVMICFCSVMNFVSAPSISLEARTLWISRSLPVDTAEILMSKVWTHITACVPFSLIASVIACFAAGVSLVEAVWLLLLPVFVNVFAALFGVVLNLKFPKMDWTSEIVAIKQGVSSLIAMFGGMAVLAAPLILYLAAVKTAVSVDAYMFLSMAYLLLLSWGLYAHLKRRGVREFEALQP